MSLRRRRRQARDDRWPRIRPLRVVLTRASCSRIPRTSSPWDSARAWRRSAPGTFGTLVGARALLAPAARSCRRSRSRFLAIPLFLLGIWACGVTGRALGVMDSGAIVWDEVVAFLPLAALASSSVWLQVVAFVLFRLFDIWKPFPIRQLERRVQGRLGRDVRRRGRGCLRVRRVSSSSSRPDASSHEDPGPIRSSSPTAAAAALAPENTLAAIRLGQSLGYTRGGVRREALAATASRCCCTTRRSSAPRAARARRGRPRLERARASWTRARGTRRAFRGERIARFDDAAQLLKSKGTLAHVEIKPSPGREKETGAHVAALARGVLARRAGAAAALVVLVRGARRRAADGARSCRAAGSPRRSSADGLGSRSRALEAVSLHTDHRKLAREDVQRAHDKGVRVLVYTVNDVARAEELFDVGRGRDVHRQPARVRAAIPRGAARVGPG